MEFEAFINSNQLPHSVPNQNGTAWAVIGGIIIGICLAAAYMYFRKHSAGMNSGREGKSKST